MKRNNLKRAINAAFRVLRPKGANKLRSRKNNRSTRYNKTGVQYAQLTAPQHYGPGQTVRNIEINLVTYPSQYYKFGDMLEASIEQRDMAVHYNYYKLLKLAVVFLPQQSSYVDTTFKFQVNWTQDTELNNINFEDNTKEVAKYRTRRQCFTFVPPDITYLVGDTTSDPVELTVINPFKYIKTYYHPNKYFPGCLAVNENGSNAMPIRVIFQIEYRGSKIPTALELNGIYSAKLEQEMKSLSIKKGEVIKEEDLKTVSESQENLEVAAVDDGDRKD
jgi:hypothetical protein